MQLNKINNFIQSNNNLNHIIDYCKEYKSKNKFNVYLVGGIIRDILNESEANFYDLDLVIDGDIEQFVTKLSNDFKCEVKKAYEFLNYKIVLNNQLEIDIAHSRKETYEDIGKLPKWCKSNILEDIKRRDFTINSIVLELTNGILQIIDPLEGVSDINNKIIRILHDNSFKDDPTRIYRALRYKSRFDFDFDSDTEILLSDSIKHIKYLSKYRKNNEILKFLNEPNISKILDLLNSNEFYKELVPENFLSKINFINKKFWVNSSVIEKIFFSLLEVDQSPKNLFLNSLNIRRQDMQYIENLFNIKEKIQNDELIDKNKINLSDEIISNLYHCL